MLLSFSGCLTESRARPSQALLEQAVGAVCRGLPGGNECLSEIIHPLLNVANSYRKKQKPKTKLNSVGQIKHGELVRVCSLQPARPPTAPRPPGRQPAGEAWMDPNVAVAPIVLLVKIEASQ